MEKLLALDTETGGIGLDKSLLEVYMEVLDAETYKVLSHLELKLKPNDGIYMVEAGGMKVNKINLVTHDEVAVTYEEARGLLRKFLNEASSGGKEKLIPLGHNVVGDIEHIYTKLLGSKPKWDTYCSYRVQDTGVIAQFLKRKGLIPQSVSGSLGSLIDFFKVTVDEALHTSKGDTKGTVGVYKAMLTL